MLITLNTPRNHLYSNQIVLNNRDLAKASNQTAIKLPETYLDECRR